MGARRERERRGERGGEGASVDGRRWLVDLCRWLGVRFFYRRRDRGGGEDRGAPYYSTGILRARPNNLR